MEKYTEGQIIEITAPFIKDKLECGYLWIHGIRFDGDGFGETWAEANGEGKARFEIIKIVEMPKPYSNRILFRKQTIDPDGNKSKWRPMQMLGPIAFERFVTGGRWEYELAYI